MCTKYIVMALGACAVQGVAAIDNHHRHLHQKKNIEYVTTDVVVTTDYTTVTCYYGEPCGPSSSSSASFSASLTAQEFVIPTPSSSSLSPSTSSTSSTPSTTSTSSTPVAVPTTPSTTPTPTTTSTPKTTPIPTTPTSTTTSTPTTLATTTTQATSDALSVDALSLGLEAATSTASSATLVSTSSSSSSSSSGKRGLAYNDATLVDLVETLAPNVFHFIYNWGDSSSGYSGSLPYIPMLWCDTATYTDDWKTNADAAIANGADAVLGFNEPDNGGQCNIDAATAAAGHIKYMNQYSGKVKVGSPAVTSTDATGYGVSFLSEWVSACDGKCEYDFCAGHWYGPGGQDGAETFLEYVEQLHQACGKPVWLTEFAPTSGDYEAFMSYTLEQLESSTYSYVERYSYFWLSTGALLESVTSLSTIGEIYCDLSS